jgi:isopenicillin N synthase-like dioxygenase
MQRFRQCCDEVHLRIMLVLQAALGLENSQLLSLCDGMQAEVRIAHYPAVSLQRLSTGSTFRIAEHTDTGTLTLLFQDSVGGLEIEEQKRPGHFMPVLTSRQSEAIVNVGDTLSLFSNGKLRSANHRVVAPTDAGSLVDGMVPERYTVAYFGKANLESKMQPLSEFLVPGQVQEAGDSLTAAEYYAALQTKTFPGQ